MSTQVLQLNQSKGRVGIQAKKPVAQGADCASAPAGIRFVAKVNPLEVINTAHEKLGSTMSARYAVVEMVKRGAEKVIVPCESDTRRRILSTAVGRTAKMLGIDIVTRARRGELHIYNASLVLGRVKPE
jgi:hypothetical protein